MIDEQHQDLAAEYALDALDPESARAFEAMLAGNPELKALADDLRETAATLAYEAPAHLPPPELRERILSSIRAEAEAVTQPIAPAEVEAMRPAMGASVPVAAASAVPPASRGGGGNILPWALAAGFAISTVAFWTERNQLQSDNTGLKSDLMALRNENALTKVRIATLSAKVDAYARASAIVVWDPQNERGVIKLANIPPAEAGKDYQLWVIGGKRPPVSAGVVQVNPEGAARILFKAEQPIKADLFAISVEPTGGGAQPTGPIVLAGN